MSIGPLKHHSNDIFPVAQQSFTPLQQAIISRQLAAALEIVRRTPQCLEQRVSVSYLPKSNTRIPPQANSLHLAAICGFAEWISAIPRLNHLEAKTAGTEDPDTEVIDRRGPSQATALHFAAYYGHFIAARALIQRGAEANAECGNGYTVLDYLLLGLKHRTFSDASCEEISAFFTILKDKGVSFEVLDKDKNNFLHHVISSSISSELRKKLCEAVPSYQKLLKQKNTSGETPFFLCALSDLELFKIFKPLCAELINDYDHQGRTLVHHAVKKDNGKLLHYLATLEECDPNMRDELKETPLHIAMRKEKETMIAHLRAFEQLDPNLPLGNRERKLAIRKADEEEEAWREDVRDIASEAYQSPGSEYSDSFDEMMRDNYEDAIYDMVRENYLDGIRDPKKDVPPLIQAVRDNQPGMASLLAQDGRTNLEIRDPEGKKAANYAKRTWRETEDRTLMTVLNEAFRSRSKGTTTGATSDPDSDQDPRLKLLEKRIRYDLKPGLPAGPRILPKLGFVALFRGINFKQHLPRFQDTESRLDFAFKDERSHPLFAFGVHDLLQESPIDYSQDIHVQRMHVAEMVKEEVRLSFGSPPVNIGKQKWNSAGLRNLQAYVNQYDTLNTIEHTVAIADKVLKQAKERLPDLAGRLPAKLEKGFKMYVSFSDGARTACRFSVALGSTPAEKASALDLHSRSNGKSKKRAVGKVYVVITTPERLQAMGAQNVLAYQKAHQIHLQSLYVFAREIAIPAYVPGESVVITHPIVMPTFNKEWKEKYQDLYGLNKRQYDRLKPQFSPKSRRQQDYQKNKKHLLERLVNHAASTLEQRVNNWIQEKGGQRIYWGHDFSFQETPPVVDITLSRSNQKEKDPKLKISRQEKEG